MRIGLFGGSFDPIHRGHVAPVRDARKRLQLDRVIYLPTARPPHKPDRRFAPPHARYAMVELALLHEEGLFASAHELTLDRPAYTVETVEHFGRQEPEAEIYLLVGADSYLELHQWRRWRDLLRAVTLVVLARPGSGPSRVDLQPELGREESDSPAGGVHWLENETVDISSTQLRAQLARGERPALEWMVPLVVDYCRKYSLYQ